MPNAQRLDRIRKRLGKIYILEIEAAFDGTPVTDEIKEEKEMLLAEAGEIIARHFEEKMGVSIGDLVEFELEHLKGRAKLMPVQSLWYSIDDDYLSVKLKLEGLNQTIDVAQYQILSLRKV